MKTCDLVNCPTTDEELACRLEAAFAIDPIPCSSEGPLRAAASAMAARKQRIFFIDAPFLLAFQTSEVRFTFPCSRRKCVRYRMGPSQCDHEGEYREKA